MSQSKVFIFICCLLWACHPPEHAKEQSAVDSLRVTLTAQKYWLEHYPLDSLEWGKQVITQQSSQMALCLDSSQYSAYQNYFEMAQSINTLMDWHHQMTQVIEEDQQRLSELSRALKNGADYDQKGNLLQTDYLQKSLSQEKSHIDSLQWAIIHQYTQCTKALQMIHWMTPAIHKEISTIKEKKE